MIGIPPLDLYLPGLPKGARANAFWGDSRQLALLNPQPRVRQACSYAGITLAPNPLNAERTQALTDYWHG